MARRSTRDIIIDVAAGLFASLGLRRTTMETIASAAGRGRRTVYMYFRNKAEIYEAVVEKEIMRITAPLGNLALSDAPLGAILQSYGGERAQRLGDLIRRNPLLMKDFAQGHSRVEKLRDKLHRAEMQILTPLFKKHLPDTEASGKISPEDCAALFMGMLRGVDRLLTKTNGLSEAIRLSSLSSWLMIRGISGI